MYLVALCLRKIDPNSLVVVGMPLSAIINDQHKNMFKCDVATLSMGAQIRGTSLEAVGDPTLHEGCNSSSSPVVRGGTQMTSSLSEEDVLSGRYSLLFSHPEAFSSKSGQKLLRALSRKGFIKAVFVDEVHQGRGLYSFQNELFLYSGTTPEFHVSDHLQGSQRGC